MKIESIRKEFRQKILNEAVVEATPSAQFEKWWQEALNCEIEMPETMTLSSVNAAGKPSSRVVLLKAFDSNGLVFFTNYNSRKGEDLSINKNVAILFYWKELDRQVRICGYAEKINEEMNDGVFNSLSRENQVCANVSPQSSVIQDINEIKDKFEEMLYTQKGQPVQRPQNWGGYVVIPETVEFFQGRANLLNDRIQYVLTKSEGWKIERLAP